ncbi:hypothetical protein [Paenibacillus terrigena]|uniref:hypothetical protein n=1 Tax=Paenibacillus terrigena TaxID=369333 RepID=UPI0028D84382|nr:hypothetical protein [Paenibacillus terrigena]
MSSKEEPAIKQRFSVEKSEWSDARDEGYKKLSYEIVFGFGDNILIENNKVNVLKNGEKFEITKPQKSKTFWYEAWLGLKDFYQID